MVKYLEAEIGILESCMNCILEGAAEATTGLLGRKGTPQPSLLTV